MVDHIGLPSCPAEHTERGQGSYQGGTEDQDGIGTR